MDIQIVVAEKYARRVLHKELRGAAQRVLALERPDTEAGLSIVIVSDRAMRDYNRRFHHVNAATDVLSFPSAMGDEYLGDVIISYDTAKANAKHAGWRVCDELELLVTHGVLHLLGYDDATPDAREMMWKRQAEILDAML
ncbi:MAG: rRNA maturation RNase YbeY [Chloroflexi bacterium]|nr:rRNA maturation RNase YbeY [Chloroflexota bacterium]